MGLHVKKGDLVYIQSGKDKQRRGKVLQAFPDEGRILVEGVNIVKKHTRPTRQSPQGGRIERPAPVYISKVMLVCPKCSNPTRIAHMIVSGRKVRKCKRCGEVIDK